MLAQKLWDAALEEVAGCEEYAQLAIELKVCKTDLSRTYLAMAEQEREHAVKLHEAAHKLMAEIREQCTVPEAVSERWEKCKRSYLKGLQRCTTYIGMYR